MSVNKYLPHIFILPEDDANRQIVNGFLLDQSVATRQIHVLEVAGGWNEVIERFCSIYASEMNRWPLRTMVLIIDFDEHDERMGQVKARISSSWPHLLDRVFILGAWSEPEDLKQALNESYEGIGIKLAQDCRENAEIAWGHRLLRNNVAEIAKLRIQARPILFPGT